MFDPFGLAAKRRGKTKGVAIQAADRSNVCFAQAAGGREQGIEHLLQVERRAADYLEHFGGGGLLL